jgi:hypothetical protein
MENRPLLSGRSYFSAGEFFFCRQVFFPPASFFSAGKFFFRRQVFFPPASFFSASEVFFLPASFFSIWIFLFFRSMENGGKPWWIFTPPE